MHTQQTDLVTLADALARAKAEEKRATERRIQIEREIIALTRFDQPEGSQTFRAANARGQASISLSQPVRYSLDPSQWLQVRRTLPQDHPARKVVQQTYVIDTRAAKALRDEDPDAWRDISQAVTSRPGKISVALKAIQMGGATHGD